MTDYVYIVDSSNVNVGDSLTLNVGDTFKITNTDPTETPTIGVYSIYTSTSAPAGLVGNFPPEIKKTSSYWKTGYKMGIMKSAVALNTPGTYTFRKGKTGNPASYLTVIVVNAISNVIHANVNGTWKDTTPYVNVNGTWKEATPYVNVNGTWKESN